MKNKFQKGFFLPIIIFVVVAVALLGGVAYYYANKSGLFSGASDNKANDGITIGFSIGTLQEERWQIDKREFEKQAEKLGVSLDVQASNNSVETQITQIRNLISKGVNVLVIAPHDATSLVDVVKEAHDAGIKVISYDRMIMKSGVDIYLSFDNEKVGELQAKSVLDALGSKSGLLNIAYIGGSTTDNNALLLKKGSYKLIQPKIDDKSIKIVLDKFTPGWDPATAYSNMKAYLDKTKGESIDGVVCANDGTAFGVIKALTEYKLAGKIPVSGQDAELAACQRVIAGTQTATVYKPIPELAKNGIEIAIKLAKGEKVNTNAKVSDGLMDVPSVLLEPVLVTKENMDATIVKDGYHSHKEIYGK